MPGDQATARDFPARESTTREPGGSEVKRTSTMTGPSSRSLSCPSKRCGDRCMPCAASCLAKSTGTREKCDGIDVLPTFPFHRNRRRCRALQSGAGKLRLLCCFEDVRRASKKQEERLPLLARIDRPTWRANHTELGNVLLVLRALLVF